MHDCADIEVVLDLVDHLMNDLTRTCEVYHKSHVRTEILLKQEVL